MNLQNVFTKMDKFLQEHLKIWDYKIPSHFPDNLDETAAQSGALQRKRGIHSVYDLLKLFFLYACSSLSFRVLAVAACALGISSVSDTALRKRFSKAAPFLHKVLHTMLSSLFSNPASTLPHRMKNILLVDASIARQTGIRQEQERIHLCYSLNQNRMKQIKVTDHHMAESLLYFTFEKGDLVMADTGYATAQNYIYAQEQQADVILRITPKTFCLYDAEDKKISLVSLLKQAEDQGVCMVDVFGICRYKSKTFCSGWIVVITTLGIEYSGEEILYLYRICCQVERLFKRLRQNFNITTTKAGSKQYAETMILLQVIIWVIAEHQAFLCECYLKEKTVYSTYENCKAGLTARTRK